MRWVKTDKKTAELAGWIGDEIDLIGIALQQDRLDPVTGVRRFDVVCSEVYQVSTPDEIDVNCYRHRQKRDIVNRRALLRSVPIAVAVGTAGCSGRLRPEARTEQGMGLIYPASEQHLDGGLHPGGSDQQFATAIPDEAPEWVGPDADQSLADRLTGDYEAGDAFHLIVQLRSSPETPRRLWPITGTALRWASWSTLQITVTNGPWEIYDEAERERLQAADELIFTSLWTVTPVLDKLPDTVRLAQQASR